MGGMAVHFGHSGKTDGQIDVSRRAWGFKQAIAGGGAVGAVIREWSDGPATNLLPVERELFCACHACLTAQDRRAARVGAFLQARRAVGLQHETDLLEPFVFLD